MSAALAPEAAMAMGIAATAMPFARTPEDEAERWLRVLRLHGEAGAVLQALGVSEGSLRPAGAGAHAAGAPAGERDAVTQVGTEAAALAGRRGAGAVATTDLLLAVMHIYGETFDSVLRAHGTDSEEVEERLRERPPPPPLDDPRR